ncbi:hypothetical protein THRCLA_06131 [Thraustotheca clavata]|uniref:Uncharacterized protein n=1 Tax=Thraustotheca clavata TaxID=74557 RepID=A0A1V9ZQB8_9STRA|nr:hypothetical protein THRCLA_06131 [Thraustotheca clavata]
MVKRNNYDLVEHALYQEQVKERIALGEDAKQIDSYRKHKWKLNRDPPKKPFKEDEKENEQTSTIISSIVNEPKDESMVATEDTISLKLLVEKEVDGKRRAYQQYLMELISPALANVLQLHFELVNAQGVDAFNQSVPCARDGATLTKCNDILVLFGGSYLSDPTHVHPRTITPLPVSARSKIHYSNHVFVFDPQSDTWEMPRCAGVYPRSRADHTAIFIPPRSLMIIGGRGKQSIVFDDVFLLDIELWHWSSPSQIKGEKPQGRFWHSATCDSNDNIYCFGGKDIYRVYGDFYRLEFKNDLLEWHQPLTMGHHPTPRFGATMLPLGNDHLAIVGGWECRSVPHMSSRANKAIDIFVLDTFTGIWSQPHLAQHVVTWSVPCERFLSQVYLMGKTLVVFGGYSYEPATKCHEKAWFELENSARDTINSPHPIRYVHGMTLRPLDDPYIYKFDLQIMIWRRQPITMTSTGLSHIPTAVHTGSYPMLNDTSYFFGIAIPNPHEISIYRLRLTSSKRTATCSNPPLRSSCIEEAFELDYS